MTSKAANCYDDVFEYLDNIFNLQPKQFMCDFEGGMRKSLKKKYPNASMKGCWFHYCACIRKRARKLGVSKLWNQKSRKENNEAATEAKKIYKMVQSLPLLPEKYFFVGYQYVKCSASKINLDKQFAKLFEYFDRTWIMEVRKLIGLILNRSIKHFAPN